MNIVEDKKLESITGGGISAWGVFGIGALVAFLSGVLDGIARPGKCN